MFNVKRNGTTVEITEIPASIPVDVFKRITNETGANECLACFPKGSDSYEVIIRHENDNMAGAVAWLALEVRESVTGDADISGIGKRNDVAHVKQYTSARDKEDWIGAPEGNVSCREMGEIVPTDTHDAKLADRNVRADFIVIGTAWKEVARLADLNYLAAKSMYESNEPLCNWNAERINTAISVLMKNKTRNAVRMINGEWEFHL